MTIAAVLTSALSTLVAHFAADRYDTALNLASPIWADEVIEKEDPDGGEIEVILLGGTNPSTAWVVDGGTLPAGHASTPVIAKAMPAFIVSKIKMGAGASIMKLNDKQMSNQFDAALEESSTHTAQVIGRGFHGAVISPNAAVAWSGTAANSTVTLAFLDISMFRPGASYDYIDTSAGISYVVRCQSVTPATVGANSDNIAGNVTFINDVPSPTTGSVVAITDAGTVTVATTDVFRARGSTAGFGGATTLLGAPMNSFDDMSGSSPGATFMGKASTDFAGWIGNYKALSAAYTQEPAVAFMKRIHTQSGLLPNVCIMSPQVAAAHMAATGVHGAAFGQSNTISASRPMQVDKSADKFGDLSKLRLKIGGADIIEDPNCVATRAIFLHNSKTKVAVWKKLGPREESGDPRFVSRTEYADEAIIDGAIQLYTGKRNSVGVLDAITGL